MQAIARSPFIPIGWKLQLLLPGEQRQHQTALLPRSACQGVTLQHLLEQGHRQTALALGG